MKHWVVVYVSPTLSHLCKWYGDHYEVEAEGKQAAALRRIADQLNGATA